MIKIDENGFAIRMIGGQIRAKLTYARRTKMCRLLFIRFENSFSHQVCYVTVA